MSALPWLDREQAAINAALAAGRFGHAPLIVGSSGVGKRALGEWLAARLLCLSPADGHACGRCESCRLLPGGTHPDFFRLAPEPEKKDIRVDQVRAFIDSVTLTPSIGAHRVGLIDPADRMNRNAANALLKTLEEPADGVWLILVTDRPDRLPVTVRSRCQARPIAVPEQDQAEQWLAGRHPDVEAAQRQLALTLADGAPCVADDWLAGDGLGRGLAIRDHLDGLLRRGDLEPSMPADWIESPDTTWRWLARWVQAWTRRARTGAADGLAATDAKPEPAVLERLERLWADALVGRSMAGDPVRHDWMMLDWLNRWRALAGRLPTAN